MNEEKKQALEATGFKVGTVEEFLGPVKLRFPLTINNWLFGVEQFPKDKTCDSPTLLRGAIDCALYKAKLVRITRTCYTRLVELVGSGFEIDGKMLTLNYAELWKDEGLLFLTGWKK